MVAAMTPEDRHALALLAGAPAENKRARSFGHALAEARA